MSARESEDIAENTSVVERDDPSPQKSPSHGSTSTKDDLMVSFLSDIRKDMQVMHKLLAQMLAQGNAGASQGAKNLGGKRTATMLEVDVSDHANAHKRRKNAPIASEKASSEHRKRFRESNRNRFRRRSA